MSHKWGKYQSAVQGKNGILRGRSANQSDKIMRAFQCVTIWLHATTMYMAFIKW